jgi:hypothetical protein
MLMNTVVSSLILMAMMARPAAANAVLQLTGIIDSSVKNPFFVLSTY